ncbi:MAG: hypothetical protein F6K14_15555 [Symploca sp. SIO2C1]|nr:hypothetical protein [Symploca sp. SIO2C1]
MNYIGESIYFYGVVMTGFTKGQTVSFRLGGHYLEKLEKRATLLRLESAGLCAKHLTIEGLEDTRMKELHYLLHQLRKELSGEVSEVRKELVELETRLETKIAKMVFVLLHEVCEMDTGDATKVAQSLSPNALNLG